jgi:hypothetical protein
MVGARSDLLSLRAFPFIFLMSSQLGKLRE